MSYVRYNNANIEIVNAAGYKAAEKSGKAEGKAHAKITHVDVKNLDTDHCENTPVTISALGSGAVAKIPVVLSQMTVQAHVNSVITLPEYAYEIKRIRKNLKITQCLLIQNTNILFLKGFIRKNIEYATRKSSN